MTDAIKDLEQDIAQTRARLDQTIDRIQDRLSASGIVDDLIGTMRSSDRFGSMYDRALALVRRNPGPVILLAAGAGWLMYRLGKDADRRRLTPPQRALDEQEGDIPVMNDGAVHAYDPDASPRRPLHDTLESRRELSAQA